MWKLAFSHRSFQMPTENWINFLSLKTIKCFTQFSCLFFLSMCLFRGTCGKHRTFIANEAGALIGKRTPSLDSFFKCVCVYVCVCVSLFSASSALMQTIQNIYPTSFIPILILIYQKICFQTDKFVESRAYQAHNRVRCVCKRWRCWCRWWWQRFSCCCCWWCFVEFAACITI